MAGLMIYWLRELANYNTSSDGKSNYACVSSCSMFYLVMLFLILSVNFMVLNCFYYVYIRSDPAIAGRFSIHNDATVDVLIYPVLVTIVLLAFYYC